MSKRIGIFFSLVTLVLAMTGTAFTSMSVSAAESETGCDHSNKSYITTVVHYPNADNYRHQKVTQTLYHCYLCDEVVCIEKSVYESHSVDSKTNKCACGFSPQVHTSHDDSIE